MRHVLERWTEKLGYGNFPASSSEYLTFISDEVFALGDVIAMDLQHGVAWFRIYYLSYNGGLYTYRTERTTEPVQVEIVNENTCMWCATPYPDITTLEEHEEACR